MGALALIFLWDGLSPLAWQANIMHHEKGGSLTLTNLLPNYLRVILYGRTDKRSLSKRHSNCVLVWDC